MTRLKRHEADLTVTAKFHRAQALSDALEIMSEAGDDGPAQARARAQIRAAYQHAIIDHMLAVEAAKEVIDG